MREKITQCRVAPHMKYFKKDFLNRWGLTDYTSPNEPCVFFGATSNWDAIQKHKGFKVILSAGPTDNIDWNALNDKSNIAVITGQNRFKVPEEIIFKQELIETRDFSLFKPNVLGDKVYYYSGLDCPNGKHPAFIKQIEDECGYEIITTFFKTVHDYKSVEWLKENFYDKCFINLNFRYPDSGMTTNKELGLMGRRTIQNSHYYGEVYKGMIPYQNIKDVSNIIKKEAEKIGTIQDSIDSHTMKTDEWLYLDFYKKEKTMGDMNSGLKPKSTIELKNLGQYNIIADDVIIEDGVKIGNFNVIESGTVIKKGAVIGNYCEIGKNNIIGENSILQGRIRTAGGCIFEKNVTAKYGTILTSDVLLKEGCFLGPHTITLGSTHERITKHGTVIGKNTYIGAGSKIAADTKIGDNIVIGALGFVNKDLTVPGIYAGLPVKFIKKNKKK